MTRYGKDVLSTFLIVAVLAVVCVQVFIPSLTVRLILFFIAALLAALVVNFFRDPERRIPENPGVVVSPADGKIVQIVSRFEPEFLKQEATLISIFMSPLDVHVNRVPVSGTIRFLRHTPGKFKAAFAEKASEANERMSIGFEPENGEKILIRQIAGMVARRIVADLRMDQKVHIGERFGMIKFGSRVDVFLPKTVTVTVRLHQQVLAGESVLATYSPNA